MKKNKHFIILGLMALIIQLQASAQDVFCNTRNNSTQNGEQINYTVYYSVAGLYVRAGSAVFTNTVEKLNGKAVFHVVCEGSSNASYDWIYKVRDRYESFIDTIVMQPLKFLRDVQEGSTRKKEDVIFNRTEKSVSTGNRTEKVPGCIHDVLSAIYAARNISYNHYKKNDTIPFKIFMDNEVHSLYIRYLGKELVKTKYGKFKAIKFKPLLLEGTIFTGGEKMTVWVSDDANHIPLRIESSILIGSIKVDMTGYKNLRYELVKEGK